MRAPRAKTPVQEPSPPRHPFVTGCHYENMKGTYEVLSIQGDTMRIRWESGEESESDVELQDRILRRFAREVRATRARPSALDEEAEPQLRRRFPGLASADFASDVSKTKWRSRNGGIGDAVARELKGAEFAFGFWAPFGRPMVLWADVDHATGDAAQVSTGFSCRLEADRAYYGFFVVNQDETDGRGAWHRFLEWLNSPGKEEWFRCLVAGHGLKILGASGACIQAAGEHWSSDVDGVRAEVESLGALLSVPGGAGTRLECVGTMEKARAVTRGQRLARDLAQLFQVLMPVYRASLGSSEEAPASGPVRRRLGRLDPSCMT